VDDRSADHEIEGIRAEEAAVQVEAVRSHAPAEFVTRLDKTSEQREEPRRGIASDDLGIRQQATGCEDAAPAARADVEDLERAIALDAGDLEAAVDERGEIESLEVALVIRLGVLDELAREMAGREVPVDQDRSVALDAHAGREPFVALLLVRSQDLSERVAEVEPRAHDLAQTCFPGTHDDG